SFGTACAIRDTRRPGLPIAPQCAQVREARMLRWFGPLVAVALIGCADDLADEDAFLDDRLDDEVIDPPFGGLPSCEGLDGTFVAEDVVVLGDRGDRAELEAG